VISLIGACQMQTKPWELYQKQEPTAKPWELYAPTDKDTPKKYAGEEAILQVEKLEGRPLSLAERRVVEEEGYVEGVYKDDKGIETSGVGQTGEWMGKSFDETFKAHEGDAKKMFQSFDAYPEYLQAELIQAQYRGDVRQSPDFVNMMSEGRYNEAAEELLNHEEYKERKAKGDDGVTRRLEALQNAVKKYRKEVGDSASSNGTP